MTDTSTALTTTEQTAEEYSITAGVYGGIQAFEHAQRIARSLAASTLVPPAYRGDNPNGLANCLIALEMAGRLRLSPLVVMQQLHIIQGRPSWSSQFLIASVNGSGRFSPLRFTMSEQNTACSAHATELATGETLTGPTVTIAMAEAEGWATKGGSKWKTMPELMLRYRAAAFWVRLFCPEISLGLATKEEAIDVEPVSVSVSASEGVQA